MTQDKGSGIEKYQVKETKYRIFTSAKWLDSTSPYILKDQDLRSFVYVKAIDKYGNERIEKILPRNPLSWYENFENWFIIVLVLLVAITYKKIIWKKLKK